MTKNEVIKQMIAWLEYLNVNYPDEREQITALINHAKDLLNNES